MLKKSVLPKGLTIVTGGNSPEDSNAQPLPSIPVLSKTLLLLHLEAQEPAADLNRLSELILGDVGATLQVLRLAGREYSDPEGPGRIEDCICDLGLQRCLDAMPVATVTGRERRAAMANLWDHSRVVAVYSKLIAKGMPGICPDRAYLAGLLHGIGWMPKIFAWGECEECDEQGCADPVRIATRLSLPGFVLDILRDKAEDETAVRWSDIVQLAHLATAKLFVKEPSDKPRSHRSADMDRSQLYTRWN